VSKSCSIQYSLARDKPEDVSKLFFERSDGGVALYDTFQNSHINKLQFFSSNKKLLFLGGETYFLLVLTFGVWLICTDPFGITEQREGYEREGAWRSSSDEALRANVL
jgi:hypothetical protein